MCRKKDYFKNVHLKRAEIHVLNLHVDESYQKTNPLHWPRNVTSVLQGIYSGVGEPGKRTRTGFPMPDPRPMEESFRQPWEASMRVDWRGGMEVDWVRGKGRADHGWIRHQGSGIGLRDLGQILNTLPSTPVLHWTAWICITNFSNSDPSSPIGVAAAQHGIRGNNFPYSELRSSHSLSCAGYNTGQLVPKKDRTRLLVIYIDAHTPFLAKPCNEGINFTTY